MNMDEYEAVLRARYFDRKFLGNVWKQGWGEGRRLALCEAILSLGRKRFGRSATPKQKEDLDAITDYARLQRIVNSLLDAASWGDLLSTP